MLFRKPITTECNGQTLDGNEAEGNEEAEANGEAQANGEANSVNIVDEEEAEVQADEDTFVVVPAAVEANRQLVRAMTAPAVKKGKKKKASNRKSKPKRTVVHSVRMP